MKYNMKNRPKRKANEGWIGREEEIDEWFEGFEKELRERLVELSNVKGRIPYGAKCHMAGEEETIKEILGK